MLTFIGGRAVAPVALCALLLAGCGGGESEAAGGRAGGPPGAGGPGGPGGPGGGGAAMRAPVVGTTLVEVGRISRDVNVSGVVEPLRSVGVNSQLAGALVQVLVEEGMAVREGQVLARMDDREIAAQVASAEADFRVRDAAYQRARQLRERQVITLAEYERDQAAYEASRAQLEQLRTRQGFATVRAPVAGVITEQRVETGDVVGVQTRLFTVGDLSTPVVRVAVSELDVVHLSPGDEVRVVLDAFPNQVLAGRIRRVFPSADPGTRLVPVEVALDRADARLARPGFLARVTFSLGARDGVRLVPAAAVQTGTDGTAAVFVVQEGRAVRKPVTTGLTSQGRVEVLTGLEAGEAVIVTGGAGLRDGSTVRVASGPGADIGRAGEATVARQEGGAP